MFVVCCLLQEFLHSHSRIDLKLLPLQKLTLEQFTVKMPSKQEAQKDLENGTGTSESTEYPSDIEKAEPRRVEGAVGEPDSDHDEVEQMDEGHLDDLVRQQVRNAICVQAASLTL